MTIPSESRVKILGFSPLPDADAFNNSALK